MARMRTLKPEFWTDDVIVELSPWARLFFMGTWNFALCDRGHLDDSPKSLKLKILPADNVDAVELVEELLKHARLIRKTTPEGRSYLQIPSLLGHSKVDARWNTRCVYCLAEGHGVTSGAPPSSPDLTETPESLSELDEKQPSSSYRKVRESKGKESTSTKSVSRRRATRLPDDFAIDGDMVAWARENAPDVDGRRETMKFVNYWSSKAGSGATKLDWVATWRNWMLTAQGELEHPRSRASPASRPKPSTTDERVNAALALGAQLRDEAQLARQLEINS